MREHLILRTLRKAVRRCALFGGGGLPTPGVPTAGGGGSRFLGVGLPLRVRLLDTDAVQLSVAVGVEVWVVVPVPVGVAVELLDGLAEGLVVWVTDGVWVAVRDCVAVPLCEVEGLVVQVVDTVRHQRCFSLFFFKSPVDIRASLHDLWGVSSSGADNVYRLERRIASADSPKPPQRSGKKAKIQNIRVLCKNVTRPSIF